LLEISDRTLIVVDSEKNIIPAINERQEPVYEDFMLPDNFTVAYATSDSGAETWINKEIKRRDKVANRALPFVKESQELLNILNSCSKLYIKNSFEVTSNA
jgi:hypothetical protein